MASPRILIVGAGIAGLSLARALEQRNITADVVERGVEHRTTGTGLYLPANAIRALRHLGLGDAVAARAEQVRRQRLLDHRGRLLTEYAVDTIWGDVGDCYAMSRSTLLDILLTGIDDSRVRLGAGVETVDAEGTVTFADGSQEAYDLVVGADGISSAVRASAFAGSSEPRFLNQICWRYIAHDTTGVIPDGVWSVRLGSRGRSFLTEPLGDGQVYCYAEINSTEPTAPAADWRTLFADFVEPIPTMLEQGADAYFAPLHEIDDDDWVRSQVVLIGDAAHACSPSMAQGCALALEDTLVLAELIAGAADRAAVPAALAAYRERRRERVRWVLSQNHRRDKARNLPGPIRNLILRRSGAKLAKANHRELLSMP
jgi:2-polyprenyl-6-methoxyphenol hydroxylase-like FAD-dependent oxidoreductase